jgi:hypothetical protein
LSNNKTELIELSKLASEFKYHIVSSQTEIGDPQHSSRDKLQKVLTSLISDFLSKYDLSLRPEQVQQAYQDIPAWTVENVLAKLRSLIEIKAKQFLREFCKELSYPQRQSIQSLLNNAGTYKFRESIESDLYVGIHTAISANFKMIGVALKSNPSQTDLKKSCEPLFRILRQIAALPLSYLMALDGLFWDSKLYSIPKEISVSCSEANIEYFIERGILEDRFASVTLQQERLGCPALKSRTKTGEAVMDLVSDLCLKTVQQYYLEYTAHEKKSCFLTGFLEVK